MIIQLLFIAEILLERKKEKKLEEQKGMPEFVAQVAMASCSSPSHSLSYNDNVCTNFSDVSSCSSISSIY